MAGLACAIWTDRVRACRQKHCSGSRRGHPSLNSPKGGDSILPSFLEQGWRGPTKKPWGPWALWEEVILFTQNYEWVVRAKDESQLPSCTARRQQAAYHQRQWVAQIGDIKHAGSTRQTQQAQPQWAHFKFVNKKKDGMWERSWSAWVLQHDTWVLFWSIFGQSNLWEEI